MQLTGKQIVERGIIKAGNGQPLDDECIQQQGVDVRVAKIYKVDIYNPGKIPAEGKTRLPKNGGEARRDESGEVKTYWLDPGYYEVVLDASCKIPNNIAGYFKSRSSVVRCGGDIRSGQYDAGFETDTCGCFLKVEIPMVIEVGARVAQFICYESEPVENTYDGQYQNQKPGEQR